jgi:hypothetical protein
MILATCAKRCSKQEGSYLFRTAEKSMRGFGNLKRRARGAFKEVCHEMSEYWRLSGRRDKPGS